MPECIPGAERTTALAPGIQIGVAAADTPLPADLSVRDHALQCSTCLCWHTVELLTQLLRPEGLARMRLEEAEDLLRGCAIATRWARGWRRCLGACWLVACRRWLLPMRRASPWLDNNAILVERGHGGNRDPVARCAPRQEEFDLSLRPGLNPVAVSNHLARPILDAGFREVDVAVWDTALLKAGGRVLGLDRTEGV